MPKVYLAGKIWKNDWRHTIFPGLREEVDTTNAAEEGGAPRSLLQGQWEYVGPFFISCDHGCFHGEDSHGVGRLSSWDSAPGGCVDPNPRMQAAEVVQACYGGLSRSDVVYAWIDRLDIYGTLVELGYAYAQGTPIYVALADNLDPRDLWFGLQSATVVRSTHSGLEGWKQFTTWYQGEGSP